MQRAYEQRFQQGVSPEVIGSTSRALSVTPQLIATPDGSIAFEFAIDEFRKYCLLNGLDDIGLTLRHADEIRAFEERHLRQQPWLANTI